MSPRVFNEFFCQWNFQGLRKIVSYLIWIYKCTCFFERNKIFRKNKMRENMEKIIMSNEVYAIRALVVLLSCLLFVTNLWMLQRFYLGFSRVEIYHIITLLGSFNLSKRRSEWSMVNSICIFIFQYNIRICTKNGTSLLSNIFIICFILWYIAPRQAFK